MSSAVQVAIALVLLLIVGALSLKPLLQWLLRRETARAMTQFRLRREALEAKFFDLARLRGKPRGLRWTHCDWQESVTFGRDLQSQLLTAFVSVEVQFEAVEGGDMEDVEAVGTIREATALFHYSNGQWGTGGKALFNMNPHDALTRLEGQFEPISS
jgi:hypothetical protein